MLFILRLLNITYAPAWLFQYPSIGHVFSQLQPGLSAPMQSVRLAHPLTIALPNVGGPCVIS